MLTPLSINGDSHAIIKHFTKYISEGKDFKWVDKEKNLVEVKPYVEEVILYIQAEDNSVIRVVLSEGDLFKIMKAVEEILNAEHEPQLFEF